MKTTATTAEGKPAMLDTDTGELTPINTTYKDTIANYWKTPYNHDTVAEAERTGTECKDPSKTQQHFKDQQDINQIVDRFSKTGELPLIPNPLQYGDLTTLDDYHTLETKLAETRALFYRLTPAIRASYRNDPGAWLEDVATRTNNGDFEPLAAMGLEVPKLRPTAEPEGGNTPGAPAPEPPKTAPKAP